MRNNELRPALVAGDRSHDDRAGEGVLRLLAQPPSRPIRAQPRHGREPYHRDSRR